jgi:hypothetical protein
VLGIVLAGPGLAAFLTGLTLAGLNLAPLWAVLALVDLRLLQLTTFRMSLPWSQV